MIIFSITYLQELINITSPELICIMPDGGSFQQITAAVGKKLHIPVLACSAALENGNARAYMSHLHADKIAAMGEVNKELYMDSGLDPERIVTTGVAHFDLLFNRDLNADNKILLANGIDVNRKFILFTTDNISYEETEMMLTGVINAVKKIKDLQLIVKVHPREDMTPYQSLVEKHDSPRIYVSKDIDLYSTISRCELLITKYSTTALEAMMIDKPVLTINLSGNPTPVPYAEEGGSLGVYHYDDIEPAIQKILYDEETQVILKTGRDKFIRRWAGEPDGKASSRIVNLMKEMIELNKIGNQS